MLRLVNPICLRFEHFLLLVLTFLSEIMLIFLLHYRCTIESSKVAVEWDTTKISGQASNLSGSPSIHVSNVPSEGLTCTVHSQFLSAMRTFMSQSEMYSL